MPHHVIVDGSNLATEGRTLPSLHQLNEAVAAYREDHPDSLITVVVDATFGHRIDPKEVPAFEKAIETNAFVAPPAGAVGRGDGFILSIAQKAGASILSNDSYQEFHGEYAWLFDEGRLIGGKPVPHVGWVFVNRVPVRGPISRRSVKEQKIVDKSPSRGRGRKSTGEQAPAISADGPMPIPKAPPPNAVLAGSRPRREGRSSDEQRQPSKAAAAPAGLPATADSRSTASKSTNDLLAFLSFVEQYPVGTAVTAVVESYSSHGAYVAIGDAKGYVPLRLMADPAPRSAREVMAIGETVTLVVHSFGAARRSIDLAVPAMAPPAPPVAAPKVRKAAAKKAAVGAARLIESADVSAEAIAVEAVEAASAVELEALAAGKPAKARGRKAASGRAKPAASDEAAPAATFETVFDEPSTAPAAEAVPTPTPTKRSRAPRGATSGGAAAGTAAAAAEAPTAKPARRTAKSAAARSSDAEPAAAAADPPAKRAAKAAKAPVEKAAGATKAAAPSAADDPAPTDVGAAATGTAIKRGGARRRRTEPAEGT